MKFFDRFRNYYSQLWQQLVNSTPYPCLICEQPGPEPVCPRCQSYLARPRNPCQGCGVPLITAGRYCGRCLQQPPLFDTVVAAYLYQPPLDKLIAGFKEQGQLPIGKGLANHFSQIIGNHYRHYHLPLPDRVTPVPLHWQRQWRRGFNQAEFLCNTISRSLNIEPYTGIKRIDRSPPQKQLTRKQRLQNLRGSFHVREHLQGQSIAIVDDVMTTGATANSLTKALKVAGAGSISVWVLARTPLE